MPSRGRLWREILWNLALMAAGSLICAVGVNGILVPQNFLSSGLMGLVLGINYLLPQAGLEWLYLLLNVPIFLAGWKDVGRRFFLYSVAGVIIFSAALAVADMNLAVENKILSAILAGIIIGTGGGIILRSRGSAGGVDILSVILLQRFSIRLGSTYLATNVLVLIAAAFVFSLDLVLYTLIFMYVTSQMLDLVVTGLSQRKAVLIISSRWSEISQRIMEKLNRGVTLLEGEGGYRRKKGKILYTVVTFRELARLKRIIRQLDPNAFVVVTDTIEVMGQRIGNQPHW